MCGTSPCAPRSVTPRPPGKKLSAPAMVVAASSVTGTAAGVPVNHRSSDTDQTALYVACDAGEMEVVLAPGDSGILLHEAVGHGLEADFNRKGVSNYSGRIGTPVASGLCTVVDRAATPVRASTSRLASLMPCTALRKIS